VNVYLHTVENYGDLETNFLPLSRITLESRSQRFLGNFMTLYQLHREGLYKVGIWKTNING